MPFVTVDAENSADIEIHFNDHGIGWTHPDEVNKALLDLLGR